ncbi:MAG: hypothetical protein ACPGSL_02520 [Vicingaceae bacterium]
MKKILYMTLLFAVVVLIGCAKNEECVCDNTSNITEEEAKDYNASLNDVCDLAKVSDPTCSIR